jgi:transposase InsO family protein
MRQDGLKVVPRKGYRQTTQSNHKRPVVPNILGREFTAAAPNLTWLSDITYVPTGQRWLYLAIVLDLYARRVVGWSMSDRLTDQLTCDALKMAVKSRRPAPALLHHSDQGVQYASLDYRSLLQESKAVISMSHRGDAYDNAPMESFSATLKKELIHRQQYQTRREARVSIFEYIAGYYNPVRLHSAIGYHSPVAYEALFVSP